MDIQQAAGPEVVMDAQPVIREKERKKTIKVT